MRKGGARRKLKFLRFFLIAIFCFFLYFSFLAYSFSKDVKNKKNSNIAKNLNEELLKVPQENLYLYNQLFSEKLAKSKILNFPEAEASEDISQNLIRADQGWSDGTINSSKKIVIVLSQQKIYFYENGALIKESIISSGSPYTPTPQGNFKIFSKALMGYGRGENGEIWAMPYWLGVVGGVGIHALPYINGVKESASSLGQPISHGCIRLPDEVAEWAYNWAHIGLPVSIQW